MQNISSLPCNKPYYLMHGKGIASNAKYHYVLYERMASDRESIQNGIEKNLFGCCV